MRHAVVHALSAVALTLVLCAPAEAAATVTVAPEGRSQSTLHLAQLEARWDVRDQVYTLRGKPVTVSGMSIDRLLAEVGVDPYRFQGTTVSAGSRQIEIAREELIEDDAFPEGRPVFYADAQGTHFLRPSSATDDADELVGEALTISLARPTRLTVSATASRTRVEVDDRIAFTATVDGAAEGEDVRVHWTFDDGASATGRTVRHAFDRPGTYKVVVGATSDADPTGAAAVVRIRVGEPPPGPDREGGGTDPDATAPDSGAATGPRRSAARPRRGRGSSRERSRRRDRAKHGKSKPSRERQQAGDPIRGTLLDATTPSTQPAQLSAARTGNPREADDDARSLPPSAAFALAALGLLGVGAWRERRTSV